MSSEAHTSAEYIKHHLQNLTYGQLPDGAWGVAHTPEEAKAMGFWAINLDTILMSFLLGSILMFVFHRAAKSISSGAPSGLQNFCEWAVEFIDGSVRGSFTAKNDMVAPLALTIFFWV
ncbi:MAG TPA: F0F1 ATP synthase subunit A, partial [Gallionella sp.]|nr:F0F1 ATP synthase subunit A [Gallionella sp.]